jgi:hypothetical protein
VGNYRILAKDGPIGHVEDFLTETDIWVIRYVVVDTRNWVPGRKVLISPAWVRRVDWSEALVHVELDRKPIEDSPEYDPTAPVGREYETQHQTIIRIWTHAAARFLGLLEVDDQPDACLHR